MILLYLKPGSTQQNSKPFNTTKERVLPSSPQPGALQSIVITIPINPFLHEAQGGMGLHHHHFIFTCILPGRLDNRQWLTHLKVSEGNLIWVSLVLIQRSNHHTTLGGSIFMKLQQGGKLICYPVTFLHCIPSFSGWYKQYCKSIYIAKEHTKIWKQATQVTASHNLELLK